MNSICTRTGDDGESSLLFGRRVAKDDGRVIAGGEVDELMSSLGLAKAFSRQPAIQEILGEVQQNLINLMGELAVVPADAERYAASKLPKLTAPALGRLDQLVACLESLNLVTATWVLPGADPASAALHLARSVCRRAERGIVGLGEESLQRHGLALRYLNRLSDALWLLARAEETGTKVESDPHVV
jgi:cob(I)alamin adenosyltransferase